ncbi:ATPase [Cutibacterium acnes JCM 18909]|nr:ATPase [Cutibacterium acnes JCM 18909]
MSEDLFGNVTSAQSDATSGGSLDTPNPDAPLAVRLRPRTIDEIVGQQHLLTPGSPLRRLAEGTGAMSVFLWGLPGLVRRRLPRSSPTPRTDVSWRSRL